MVKYSVCKPKLSHSCKNLSGIDTVLRIDKQGKSVIISLEQKIVSSLLRSAVHLIWIVVIVFLTHFFVLNNFDITKYVTAIIVIVFLYLLMGVVREGLWLLINIHMYTLL
jgi:hypothetical protein